MQQVTLEIRMWGGRAPKHPGDLSEQFTQHLERVAGLTQDGYTSGQIIDDKYRGGWWDVRRGDNRQEVAKRAAKFIANNCDGKRSAAMVSALMEAFGLDATDLQSSKKPPRSHSAELR